MQWLFEILVWLLAIIVTIPMFVLVLESLAALIPQRQLKEEHTPERARCAVLMPAHNEEAVIDATLASVLPQLQNSDRLVVVADNCQDRTAELARTKGAMVLERTDPTRRGKGYALDFGIRHLEADPPEVVVLVDADCVMQPRSIDRLLRYAATSGRPAQAVYLLDDPPNPTPRQQLSGFAFLFKNLVRPLGLHRLGMPCLLTGTGMAFPWPILRSTPLASGNIVEDMQMGIDLAVQGHAPTLCATARVSGVLPSGQRAGTQQRTRWEHGHIQTLLTQAPRLMLAGLRQLRLDLLGLALELSVPPLSLLFCIWVAALTLAMVAWWQINLAIPAMILIGDAALLVLAIGAAWAKYGRERLPLSVLLLAPVYVLGKLPIYLKFLVRRQKAWVRTERSAVPPLTEEKQVLN